MKRIKTFRLFEKFSGSTIKSDLTSNTFEVTEDIEEGIISVKDDLKKTSRTLIDKHDWDQHDAKKVWTFGPENSGPNLLIDQTKAVQYLTEIKDSMESAFQWVTREGVVADECMRGIRFNIIDVELHADAIHRGK